MQKIFGNKKKNAELLSTQNKTFWTIYDRLDKINES